MQTLELTEQEIEVLRDVLQERTKEIEVEVMRTDTHDYKEMLKRRRGVLEHLLGKVSAIPISV